MFLIVTTYPNKPRELKRFILGMIKGKLAACVQRVNYVKSYYMREGKLTQNEEKQLLIKCTADKKEKLLSYITKNHPYKTPEIIVIKPDDVNETYINRMRSL